MTTRADIAGVAGDDLAFSFALIYNGAPLNLGSYTPFVVVKASAKATDASGVTYAVSSGIQITKALRGKFTLSIPRASTGAAGTTWYRCFVTDPSGNVATAMLGSFTLASA